MATAKPYIEVSVEMPLLFPMPRLILAALLLFSLVQVMAELQKQAPAGSRATAMDTTEDGPAAASAHAEGSAAAASTDAHFNNPGRKTAKDALLKHLGRLVGWCTVLHNSPTLNLIS